MRMRQMQRYHDFIDDFILSYYMYVNKVHMEFAKITMDIDVLMAAGL